jgi:hypothetical protein
VVVPDRYSRLQQDRPNGAPIDIELSGDGSHRQAGAARIHDHGDLFRVVEDSVAKLDASLLQVGGRSSTVDAVLTGNGFGGHPLAVCLYEQINLGIRDARSWGHALGECDFSS